jgi:predicted MPP superfamily phosphohydrolase
VSLGSEESVRQSRPSAQPPAPGRPAISRRGFLFGAGAALATGVTGDLFAIEPRRVLVSRHAVPIPGLPGGLDGLRIAQLSDIHLPANRPAADRTLALLRAERPDIVVFTGDQCENRSAVEEVIEFVHAARGRVATIAVLGNWDYRGRTIGPLARQAYERAGATLLVNQHTIVTIGGASLAFVGLDDVLSGSPQAPAALDRLPADIPTIWGVHEPRFADELTAAAARHPALVLSGHTHGGQIRFPGLPPFTPPGSGRFVAGWYDSLIGRLYVSRGIGTADIRARFFCPPELPIFTLRRHDG